MRACRTFVVALVCCTIVLARLMGVHLHSGHPHDEHHAVAQAVGIHDHGTQHVISGFDFDHATDHVVHGDVDADSPDETTGKLPSLTLGLLLAILAGFSLAWATRVFLSPPRPVPLRTRRAYFLPPPHAPPVTG